MVNLETYDINSPSFGKRVIGDMEAAYRQGGNNYTAIVKMKGVLTSLKVPHLDIDRVLYSIEKEKHELKFVFVDSKRWLDRDEKRKIKFALKRKFLSSKYGKQVEAELANG